MYSLHCMYIYCIYIIIHLLIEVLTDIVAFCSSYLWHSTPRVTVYVVPGFRGVMLTWRSGFIILLLFISSEAFSDCHCCHESMYLPFLQQDSLWSQVRFIHVVPTVTFSMMGGRGTSAYVDRMHCGNNLTGKHDTCTHVCRTQTTLNCMQHDVTV